MKKFRNAIYMENRFNTVISNIWYVLSPHPELCTQKHRQCQGNWFDRSVHKVEKILYYCPILWGIVAIFDRFCISFCKKNSVPVNPKPLVQTKTQVNSKPTVNSDLFVNSKPPAIDSENPPSDSIKDQQLLLIVNALAVTFQNEIQSH